MRRNYKKMNMRLSALVLVVLLLLCQIPAVAAAEAEGNCGDGVSWSLDGGVLTISGKGAIKDYTELSPAPWNAYADTIRAVIVQDGVTNVGRFAFFMMQEIMSVTLASTVKTIGDWAFTGCEKLVLLDLGTGVEEIGESAFEYCISLSSIRLPDSLRILCFRAFYRCEKLVSVTVPQHVSKMEPSVFAYCFNLRNATVLADVKMLPIWTFYGCKSLESVSLAPVIQEVGANAFYECNLTEEPKKDAAPGDVFVSTSTKVETDEGSVTTKNNYSESSNSTITSQTVTKETAGSKTSKAEIDAVLDNPKGWTDLSDRVGLVLNSGADQVNINVYIKGESVVSGSDINRFNEKNIKLNIHTPQGAIWHIQAENLKEAELAEKYDLSFTLRPLAELTDKQTAAVGDAQSYSVEFHNTIDFKVEVELPLGKELARQTAVFFAPNEDGDFERMQAVMIDNEGIAHFYLGFVDSKVEYLIGINVPKPQAPETPEQDSASDIIIPEVLIGEQSSVVQMEPIPYIITGRKSSWGMNINQVTWIMVGVLVACVVVVGVIMFMMNKRKLKMGYVADPEWEEDEE